MVYLTKEQIIKRKRLAKFRFKTLVRKAFFNKAWLSDIDDQIGEDAKRNVAIILKRSRHKGTLTLLDKSIIKTPLDKRDEEEMRKIEKVFDKISCFQRFPANIRKSLATVVEFYYYPKGKRIYMEGHPSQSMSFIVSGEVLVSRMTFNKSEGKITDEPVNLLVGGESFGEIGLLYDERRNASCTTETDCELLLLYKEEFDKILKANLEAKHENIKKALQRFEYFNNYTVEKIRECCVISKIEQYNPQDIIHSQNDISNYSYFVLSGKCMILQCLKLREQPNGKCVLVAPKKRMNALDMAITKNFSTDRLKSITDGDDASIKYQFVDVGTFTVGAVFGIRENIENRVIIARTTVQCLLIPRPWLFQKAQNVGNVWQRIKLFLNSSIPSQEKLFQEHLRNKKWKKYKRNTIEQIKQHYKIMDPETRYYNIPIVCRIQEQ